MALALTVGEGLRLGITDRQQGIACSLEGLSVPQILVDAALLRCGVDGACTKP